MKKSMNKVYIAVFAGLTIFMSACVKDLTNTVYNGPSLVEFANPISKSVTTTVTPRADSILVQLVGPQRSTPTNVTFRVVDTSTAVSGTDFVLVTPSPVVIPANSSRVWIKFTLNKVSSTKLLWVDLTGGDNVTPSTNFRRFTYTLR